MRNILNKQSSENGVITPKKQSLVVIVEKNVKTTCFLVEKFDIFTNVPYICALF